MAAILEMKNICKQFPGVLANENVCFSVEKGEVHALLGENGAGKSTLMNVLCGLYKPTSGEVYIEGKPICSYVVSQGFTIPMILPSYITMILSDIFMISSISVETSRIATPLSRCSMSFL